MAKLQRFCSYQAAASDEVKAAAKAFRDCVNNMTKFKDADRESYTYSQDARTRT